MRFVATLALGAFLATSVFSAAFAEDTKTPAAPAKPAVKTPAKPAAKTPAKPVAKTCKSCPKGAKQCKCPAKPATKPAPKKDDVKK